MDALLHEDERADAADADVPRMRAFNLGTGRPYSVREVVQAVERVTGRSVPVTPAPRRPGDPAVLFAAAGQATAALGWRPHYTSLEEIVETAWRWHEAHPRGFGG